MRISIVGLGKIGSCLVSAYASAGHQVTGYDIKEELVNAITQHRAPFPEPQLQELLTEHAAKIRATNTISRAVEDSDISFVIVPTPSLPDGTFDTTFAEKACESIGAALKNKNEFHVVSIVSTVLPGDSYKKLIPVLERTSGKKSGVGFGYAYNPSFIALGEVVKNLLYPDMHLVGADDEKTTDVLSNFYRETNKNGAPVESMSIVSAEIAKIALNAYITQKITFANRLADFASRVPKADVDDITRALGADSRIGKKYLKGGLGYGGPCFPRDNKAFAASAQRWGSEQKTALSIDDFNNELAGRIVDYCFQNIPTDKTIGILGTSYKPNTDLLEESPSIEIAKYLLDRGYEMIFFNPPPASDPSAALGVHVSNAQSLKEALEKSDVYFIAYPSKVFDEIVSYLKKDHRKKIVIDPWRLYRELALIPHVSYISFGIGSK